MMNRTSALLVLLSSSLLAQLPKATGDEFTLAIFNDTHTARSFIDWVNTLDWLTGQNGRGPGGQSAVAYWHIKAISGVGDYASTGSDDCNAAAWNDFATQFARIRALALPGIWPAGNHDNCPQYASLFGTSLQSSTVDISTRNGPVKLGLIGVGAGDDMSQGTAGRKYVDGVLATSEPTRQWIFLRHVMTYGAYNNSNPNYRTDATGGSWCDDNATCAGYSGPNSGAALRDNFLVAEPRIFWAVGGHNGYVTNLSVNANDGHVIYATGNLGASGGTPGWITLLKFQPSLEQIQGVVYLGGSPYTSVWTWDWIPSGSKGPIRRKRMIGGGHPPG